MTPSGPAVPIFGSTISATLDPVTGTVTNGAQSIYFGQLFDTPDPVPDDANVSSFTYAATVHFVSAGAGPVSPTTINIIISSDGVTIDGSFEPTPNNVTIGAPVPLAATFGLSRTVGQVRALLWGCAIGMVIQAGFSYTQDIVFSDMSLTIEYDESGGGSLSPGSGVGGGGELVTFTHE